ncbi:hypothetical protein ACIBSV_27160 [Embleya sp. NPDC050154]|uniref:hypothetical protein n=1 Tax=Embleya sp. NPDC050154 TaxID=3363988 RepID=UPI0037AF9F46
MTRPRYDTGRTRPASGRLFNRLWRACPAARPHLDRLAHEAGLDATAAERAIPGSVARALNPYSVLSEAFFWPVLAPAARTGDVGRLPALAAIVEALLASSDEDVRDATHIRVLTPLSQDPELWPRFHPFAGPRLLAAVHTAEPNPHRAEPE